MKLTIQTTLPHGRRIPTSSASEVLLVAPTEFEYNDESAQDNAFMNRTVGAPSVLEKVAAEFEGLVAALQQSEIAVNVVRFEQRSVDRTPDAVFPNNWFSTHSARADASVESTLVLYPMRHTSRQRERCPELVDHLQRRYGRLVDLSSVYERAGQALEGTGSLVLDHANRVAYLAVSERSSPAAAKDWAERIGFKLVSFSAFDAANRPIYHTNVVMSVGTRYAVVCFDCMPQAERAIVRSSLEASSRTVIDISLDQMSNFCGNIIELSSCAGRSVLMMSRRAFWNFSDAQRGLLNGLVDAIRAVDFDTIELVGGGSVRCAIAELY